MVDSIIEKALSGPRALGAGDLAVLVALDDPAEIGKVREAA